MLDLVRKCNILLILFNVVDCANILAAVPSPFYSHQATYRPVWRELARRGHKLTLITANPMEPNENITQIDFSEAYTLFEKYEVRKLMMKKDIGWFSVFSYMTGIFEEIIKFQFTHPDVIKLLNSDNNNVSFDLIMVEFMNAGWSALSHKFKARLVQMTTVDVFPHLHASMGNAIHPAIFPIVGAGPAIKTPLGFLDRLYGTCLVIADELFSNLFADLFLNKYVRKYVASDSPDVSLLQRNSSLIFVNANPIFHSPRPITPTTVNLNGGLQLTEEKPLPMDIDDFLNKSRNGCIYISFGTAVDKSAFTTKKIEILLETFRELSPINFLWKFDETIPNIPKNIKIGKWLPQQDILRHPNIKLFITQGGLHSLEEGIEYAVPMLGIPLLGDQMHNVYKMVEKKFGLEIDFDNIDKESLKSALLELLHNPLYRSNVQKYSKIQKDRPMRPVDLAVYWIEYVIKHGTAHLRSPSADIPLHQYFFLDMILFFIFVVISLYIVLKICIYVILKIYRYVIPKNKIKTC